MISDVLLAHWSHVRCDLGKLDHHSIPLLDISINFSHIVQTRLQAKLTTTNKTKLKPGEWTFLPASLQRSRIEWPGRTPDLCQLRHRSPEVPRISKKNNWESINELCYSRHHREIVAEFRRRACSDHRRNMSPADYRKNTSEWRHWKHPSNDASD